jgi:cyclic AMP-responsive element-binding protein 5
MIVVDRAAATRCREKRKQWIVGLEKKAEDVSAQNAQLQQEVLFLKNEVAQLKSLLLAHKDCPVTVAQQEQMKQLQASSSVPPGSLLLLSKTPDITTLTSTAVSSTVSNQETAEQVATTALASMARQNIPLQKLSTTGVN